MHSKCQQRAFCVNLTRRRHIRSNFLRPPIAAHLPANDRAKRTKPNQRKPTSRKSGAVFTVFKVSVLSL
jgi:hypothetical protein